MTPAAGRRTVRRLTLVAALLSVAAVLVVGLLDRDTFRPTSAAWTDPAYARASVEVRGPVAPEAITAGRGFTCALVDGASWCWGLGDTGQLGNGGTATAAVPVATSAGAMGDAAITALDAGVGRACAVAGGAAYCWGQGGGSLGNFDTTAPWNNPDSAVPVAVYAEPAGTGPWEYESPLAGRTAAVPGAGDALGCASTTDGTLACWGNQVGFPRPTDQNDPRSWANAPIPAPNEAQVPTSELPPGAFVTHVTTDFNTGCLIADGNPYCWGTNQEGQVGNGESGSAVTTPQEVETGQMTARPVQAMDGGTFHSCALAAGSAYCWGLRASGQIGDSTDQSGISLTPRRAALPDGVTTVDVAAGGSTTCALTDAGLVYCWGSNENGQLGNNGTDNAMLPVLVDTSQLPDDLRFTAIAVGSAHACAVGTDGEVYCWGQAVALGTGPGAVNARRPDVPVTQTWAEAP